MPRLIKLVTSSILILLNCFHWLGFCLSPKDQPLEVVEAAEVEVVEDEVEQGVGLVEDLVDVVEEDFGVLGVVVVGEVLVEAGVVVLEAEAVEGSEAEVDHRSFNLPPFLSFFRSLVNKLALGGNHGW